MTFLNEEITASVMATNLPRPRFIGVAFGRVFVGFVWNTKKRCTPDGRWVKPDHPDYPHSNRDER